MRTELNPNAYDWAWSINNSAANELTSVTPTQADEAMTELIARRGERYAVKFGLRTRLFLDTEDREDLARIISGG